MSHGPEESNSSMYRHKFVAIRYHPYRGCHDSISLSLACIAEHCLFSSRLRKSQPSPASFIPDVTSIQFTSSDVSDVPSDTDAYR